MKNQSLQKVGIDGFPERGQDFACQKKCQENYREKEKVHELEEALLKKQLGSQMGGKLRKIN